MKFIYQLSGTGQANIRGMGNNYVPAEGETVIESDGFPDPNSLHSLTYLQDGKIQEAKQEAGRRIDDILSDWRSRRHRDQVELGMSTTITPIDYTAKQQKCQAVRDASGTIEAGIRALADRQQIIDFDVVNHPAWPA